MKNKAFTMAEVLITLGILGVVISLTLPAVLGKYQKQEALVRLKRTYTLLNQALMLAENKYGEAKDWTDWNSSEKIINDYLAPEFKVNKIYESNDTLYEGMCYSGEKFFHTRGQYNWLNGVVISSPMITGTTSFMTIDGICIGLSSTSATNANFFVDVNGPVKGPNVAGKDLFFFVLEGNTIRPYGYDWKIEDITANKPRACNINAPSGAGYTCTAKIMNDGWEMRNDYPW